MAPTPIWQMPQPRQRPALSSTDDRRSARSTAMKATEEHVPTPGRNCRIERSAVRQTVAMRNIDDVSPRIERHAGSEFKTRTGIVFTYRVPGRFLRVTRDGREINRSLSRTNFAKALENMPTERPSDLKDRQGSAYTWGILMIPGSASPIGDPEAADPCIMREVSEPAKGRGYWALVTARLCGQSALIQLWPHISERPAFVGCSLVPDRRGGSVTPRW